MRKKTRNSSAYRLRNWSDYNTALVQRGSLTLWLAPEIIAQWKFSHKRGHSPRQKRGHPRLYSDKAIEFVMVIKELYRLPLRAAEGFVRSIFELKGLRLPVPNYTTLSRRLPRLRIELPATRRTEPLHLAIDSTGLKVFGEGEWKVKKHGPSKHRRWLKIHLGVDGERGTNCGEIRTVAVSTNSVSDGEVLPLLLEAEPERIGQVTGDQAYDSWRCYEAVEDREALGVFPPPRVTEKIHPRIKQHGNSRARPLDRDTHIRAIRRVGRKRWKKDVRFHRRSISETDFFRLKNAFGDRVSTKRLSSQANEVFLRCRILNIWSSIGMPDSYRAA